MMEAVWRQEDEALLERLENELVLERMWRFQAGEAAAPPHPRAAGMIALLRRMPGGDTAISDALGGRFQALFKQLLPNRLGGQPPELLHHAALYYARLADAFEATSPERSTFARVAAMAAWIALGEEKQYLRSLAAAIAGGALPEADVERAAEDAAMEPIDHLARVAKEGAHEQTPASRLAIAALIRVAEACTFASSGEATRKAAIRRAERARAAAADEALQPIAEALNEASARGDVQLKAPALFERVAAVWAWSMQDETVEVFAIEQATPIAWEIQRESRWEDLRRLLSPLFPLADRLAQRIEADPTRIAYAGPCAQMYVFRVEMERDLEQRLALAERSVKLCPTHRNGRLVLASALCDKAIRIITPTGWLVGADAVDQADALVRRAEQLFPALKKLEDVKKRVAESRRAAGAFTR
jgi:hypothetical protein